MALAHPLHFIRSRSRNKECGLNDVFHSDDPNSGSETRCILVRTLLQYRHPFSMVSIHSSGFSMPIWTMWCSALAILHRTTVYRTVLGYALFWCWMSLSCFLTNIAIRVFLLWWLLALLACLCPWLPHLNSRFWLLETIGNFGSAIDHLLGCFCPCIFF